MSAWILETLAATTLLMLIVLMVRGRVATLFGPRIAYLLWLLPALRMVLPPLPESLGPPPLAQIPVIVNLSAFIPADTPAMAAAPLEQAFPWMTALFALWLGGALAHLGWHLIAYRRFVREALSGCTDLPELDASGIEVCASKAVEGPFAAGIFLPTIVLPHDYRTRYTTDELRLAMRHETIHHERGDLSVNLLALVMLSLHWFNPVAHRAWRAFRTDQEFACDALVLNGTSPDERHSYGLALVKSACRRTPVAACSLNPRDQLKRRLRMMKSAGQRHVSGSMLAMLLVAAGLAVTASGGLAAETTREIRREVAEKVFVPAAQAVGMVQPPAPPEAPAPQDVTAPPAIPRAPEPVAAPEDRQGWTQEDAEDLRRDLEDARRDREEALKDAEQARREAQADVQKVRRTMPVMVTHTGAFAFSSGSDGKCKNKKSEALVSVSGEAGKVQRTSVVMCGPMMTRKQIAGITLDAMHNARNVVEQSRDLAAFQRAKALAAMDVEIARLKQESGKPE